MKLNVKFLLGAVLVVLLAGNVSCFAGGVGDALKTAACSAAKKIIGPKSNATDLRFKSPSCQIPAWSGANGGLTLSASPTVLPSVFADPNLDQENRQFSSALITSNPTSVLLPSANVSSVKKKVCLPKLNETQKVKKATNEVRYLNGKQVLPLKRTRLRSMLLISREQKNDRVKHWIEQDVEKPYTPASLF